MYLNSSLLLLVISDRVQVIQKSFEVLRSDARDRGVGVELFVIEEERVLVMGDIREEAPHHLIVSNDDLDLLDDRIELLKLSFLGPWLKRPNLDVGRKMRVRKNSVIEHHVSRCYPIALNESTQSSLLR